MRITNELIEKKCVLDKAMDAVEARGRMYGPPEIHFARTVGAINHLLRHKLIEDLTPEDWATCMIVDKLARNQQVPQLDNAVDICGYAACLGHIQHGPKHAERVLEVGR